jgi:CelD/BcsL family acetyltransferase involved in cellulose biosynthesis
MPAAQGCAARAGVLERRAGIPEAAPRGPLAAGEDTIGPMREQALAGAETALADAPALAVEPFPGLEALGAWWTELEPRADGGFYLGWHWIGAMLAESAIAPLVVVARAGGCPVALGLFHPSRQRRLGGLLRSRRLCLNETGDPVRDAPYIEYNGFLVDRAYGAALEQRLVAFVAGEEGVQAGLPEWDEIRFAGVPERYRRFAAATGLAVRLVAAAGTARVDLQAIRASGRPYPQHLSANTRHQLRRAMRGYARHGPLALDAAGTVGEAHAYLDALAALHQAYWTRRGRPGAFAHPYMAAFHRRLIASALPRGAVELLRLRAGARTIGYLYNFIHRGWVGAYCSGFAYDDDPKLKPGYVGYALCVDRHLAAGSLVLDFLAGDGRYKTSLGRAAAPLFHFDLQRPRPLLRLEAWLRGLRNRLRPHGGRD